MVGFRHQVFARREIQWLVPDSLASPSLYLMKSFTLQTIQA